MIVFPRKNDPSYDQRVGYHPFEFFLKFFINSQLNKNYFLLANGYYTILIKLRIMPIITNFIKCSVLLIQVLSQVISIKIQIYLIIFLIFILFN